MQGALKRMYNLSEFLHQLHQKNRNQSEFLQATQEVLESVIDVVQDNPRYIQHRILERITEPDRIISFRVEWEDDEGKLQVNRGTRVQFNRALGPYKGGLRFHPGVSLGTLKFLGFEQTFKNSLTSLPLGGAKGGSDFNPKGKSDGEILRFCRSFMSELAPYIGPHRDIPAGDVGVGTREIGYLYGQYKRLRGEHTAALTGKGLFVGGSLLRPEATGFGGMYFTEAMLNRVGDSLEGKRIALSGYGNVAWGAAIKATEMGAKVVTISGQEGFIYDEEGINTPEKWNFMLQLRLSNTGLLSPYAKRFHAQFYPRSKPWNIPVDIAFMCAFQNEMSLQEAKTLHNNGVKAVVELSNMGAQREAMNYLVANHVLFAPGKAANAGGVAVSALEMSQQAIHLKWTKEEVDQRLHSIMKHIHLECIEEGQQQGGYINYVKGANISAFKKVADAMIDLGY